MRLIMFGLGIAAIAAAGFLAAQDNTAHVTLKPQVAAARPTATFQSAKAPQSGTVPGVFLVHEQEGPVAYDESTGKVRYSLPRGMASADGKHYYAARTDSESTAITSFELQNGKPQYNLVVAGRWSLEGVSATGRWLALHRLAGNLESSAGLPANKRGTELEIVDTTKGTIAHQPKLDGNFSVDALSADGFWLFLIEHLSEQNTEQYALRLYDMAQGQLLADPLRQKGNDEEMVGEAWKQVASPEGHWLLTLYLNTQSHTAFIHTLDLFQKYPVCIDLPKAGGNLDSLRAYALALAPDGRMVYATNTALGVVVQVSLETLDVVRTVTFKPPLPGTGASVASQAPVGWGGKAENGVGSTDMTSPSSDVLSQDGKMLYFAAGREVWGYDTDAGKVIGPYPAAEIITGLGLSADGKRLFAANGTPQASVYDIHPGGTLE